MANIGVIFARGGSVGVPGKNIKMLGGKPLIAWSIAVAQQTKSIDRIFVSTDSQAIADIARQYGAEVPFLRPAELALNTSPEWHSWQHFVHFIREQGIEMSAMVSLPTTSPFRTPQLIESCIDLFEKQTPDAVITVAPARRHPAFNMISIQDGRAFIYEAGVVYTHRQSVPVAYDMSTAVYVVRPEFILEKSHLFEGNVVAQQVEAFASIDIDTPFDFTLAEAIEPFWNGRHSG